MGCSNIKRNVLGNENVSEKPCIVMIGAPDSGTTTQTEKICEKYAFQQISSGTMLKTEIGSTSDIGQQAKSFVDEGKLVPDIVMYTLIKKALSDNSTARVILNGFPKTLDQAKKLDEILPENAKKLYAVIYLDVPDAKLIERMTGKLVHTNSGRTYHLLYNPPKKAGKDDVTGEALVQPEECKEATVKTKLSEFHASMDPVIAYYEQKGVLRKVNGDQDIDAVWSLVEKEAEAVMTAYNADKKERLEKEMNSGDEAAEKPADEPKEEAEGGEQKAA
eukprot:TRINITY_DN6868_c0_g1_i5.p1 TRINITY_DN6868_c0_g1~~TRINITY_DN6868_c0_g1_i5.p1  ORF type:complete len:320 (-),score=131.24 TRINITY_DN6868_c0_g1_i5:142-969(-)